MNRYYNRLSCLIVVVSLVFIICPVIAQENLSLVEAAKNQDWQTTRFLLQEENVNINARMPDGTTALSWAVYWEHLPTVQGLLEAGADPDIGNDYGLTPLFLAIKNHSNDLVRLLIKSGADPNAPLWNGVTPLMVAAQTGQIDSLKVLLDNEAEINFQEPRREQSALMWAISFGQPDAARLLIERGADVNASTTVLKGDYTPMVVNGYNRDVVITPQGGYTPLMFAARAGDIQTARLLLEKGVNVNGVKNDHGPPLVVAAAEGFENLAIFLLEQGADPDLTDADGMTALHYAMRDGLKFLHNIKVTGKPRDQDTNSLLPGNNMYDLTRALLKHSANPNAVINYPPPKLRIRPSRSPRFNLAGATPLLLAAATQDLTAMEMLLDAGAHPLLGTTVDEVAFNREVQNHGSENQVIANATPLMVAVGMGRRNRQNFSSSQEKLALEAARMLVNLGADVKAATASGWTPLHAAAFIGADSLVKFLVDEGADINVKNGCDQTPLTLAMRISANGLTDNPEASDAHENTTELLLELGAKFEVASGPVGKCVLGRQGLQVDIEREKKIQELRIQSKTN